MANNATITRTDYRNLLMEQSLILRELAQVKAKIAVVGSLRKFEALAKRGRKFAKKAGISQSDVLRAD
ncbi:MAG: hypothetical protein HYW65_01595 [Candidatus Liptonbacteria bacterium]|nr:hypothetical protein [Candidatus Liptonbacteria bacterium]